jgi:hypothetical protein
MEARTTTNLMPLADYSRQEFTVGNPPNYLFDSEGRVQSKELFNLSTQLRIANALEAQTELAEDARRARFTEQQFNDGLNHLHASHVKDSRTVKIDFLGTSPALAEEFVKNLAQVLEAAIAKAKEAESEGAPSSDAQQKEGEHQS